MQKTSAVAQLKLPRLRDESSTVVNRTGRMNSSVSPNKNESPSKSALLGNLRNQKFEKMQLIVPQDVPIEAGFSESISARAWLVCRREPFSILKCRDQPI